jgi:hypothetical protein
MDQVQTLYINPNNFSPDKPYSKQFPNEKQVNFNVDLFWFLVKNQFLNRYFSQAEVIERIPKIFLILGTLFSVLHLTGNLILSERREDKNAQKNEHPSINSDLISIDSTENLVSSKEYEETNSLGVRFEKTNFSLYIFLWKNFCLTFKKKRYKVLEEGVKLKEVLTMPVFYMLMFMGYLNVTGPGLCLMYWKVSFYLN